MSEDPKMAELDTQNAELCACIETALRGNQGTRGDAAPPGLPHADVGAELKMGHAVGYGNLGSRLCGLSIARFSGQDPKTDGIKKDMPRAFN
jgi:hypothetical protein